MDDFAGDGSVHAGGGSDASVQSDSTSKVDVGGSGLDVVVNIDVVDISGIWWLRESWLPRPGALPRLRLATGFRVAAS